MKIKPIGPNHLKIYSSDGTYLQSYKSIIALGTPDGSIILDSKYWNYSRTTRKYRIKFLKETTKETQEKIDSGKYTLSNLNG